jgi:hypothetical protein
MALHFSTPFPTLSRPRVLLATAVLALLSACQSAPMQPAARNAAAPTPAVATATAAAPTAIPVSQTADAASESRAASPLDETPSAPILGKRADAHGCKPSTGHAWCERTKSCERPWELALQRGFENTQDGWHAYCEGATR